VLATIEQYHVGFFIQDQTDPPADPAKDLAPQFARIDNHTRHLLPSTSTIAEVVKCLCESKGGKGPKGDPGPPGQNGNGLNVGLPKIIDIGWVHNDKKSTSWDDFVALEKYHTTNVSTANVVDQVVAHIKKPPLLMIYFNQPTLTGIDRQTFRVSIEYPAFALDPKGAGSFAGIYAQPINLYGYPVPIPGPLTLPHITGGETAQSAWAFIPDQNFFDVEATSQFLTTMFMGVSFPDLKLDLPCVHVTLKGDFVFAAAAFGDNVMLDADNIGGQVGNDVPRGGIITGGKNPSGDMVEGGDFEGWFFLRPPKNLGLAGSLTHLNSASASDLASVPGISLALAKKIVAEREAQGSFRSFADLSARLNLTDKILNSFRDHVTLN